MPFARTLQHIALGSGLLLGLVLVYGCGSVNMHCNTAGPGYNCTQVTEAPPRHTRTPYQPVWSDEFHSVGTTKPQVSEAIVRMTNGERETKSLRPLQHDSTLSRIACWHNQDMLGHNYVGHEDSDDRMPSDRVAREHRRLIGIVGENAYRGGRLGPGASPDRKREWGRYIMDEWMDSPGHRANILDHDWTHLGACVTQDSVQSRASQVFADVYAYLDAPLPWTMPPGDSVSVSFSLTKAEAPPTRYQFVPAGQPLRDAFSGDDQGRSLNGTLHVPDAPGKYELRVLIPTSQDRYLPLGGPRVWVKPPDVPAY